MLSTFLPTLWLGSAPGLRHVPSMGVSGQAAGGKPAIIVQGLACLRGGHMLFTDLGFALDAGHSALVSGPNGIGKSSLLRVLGGLLSPFAGDVTATGAFSLADDRLALDLDRPLVEALGFWTTLDGRPDSAREAAMAAMDLTALGPVPVRMLSTGQRKRAVLARTIASGASIWLLDEPANGLDAASLALLGVAVERHLASGGIVIAASHQPLPWTATIALTLTRPAGEEAA